jgi:hypothetical protein
LVPGVMGFALPGWAIAGPVMASSEAAIARAAVPTKVRRARFIRSDIDFSFTYQVSASTRLWRDIDWQ